MPLALRGAPWEAPIGAESHYILPSSRQSPLSALTLSWMRWPYPQNVLTEMKCWYACWYSFPQMRKNRHYPRCFTRIWWKPGPLFLASLVVILATSLKLTSLHPSSSHNAKRMEFIASLKLKGRAA